MADGLDDQGTLTWPAALLVLATLLVVLAVAEIPLGSLQPNVVPAPGWQPRTNKGDPRVWSDPANGLHR